MGADPDRTAESVAGKLPPRLIQTMTRGTGEDRRAQAIREAYEEQMLRDRQEWTINALTFEESKSRSGPGFSSQESVRQTMNDPWSHLGWDGSTFKDGRRTLYTEVEGGAAPGYLMFDFPGIDQSMTRNGSVGGQPVGAPMFWRDPNGEGRAGRSTDIPDTNVLDTENSGNAARMNDLQRMIDAAYTQTAKYRADMEVFQRQLELQVTEVETLTTRVEEHRTKLSKQPKGLSELQEEEVTLPKATSMVQAGGNVNVVPKKPLEAKVTAVAPEIGLVVISMGKDDGLLEGDEFTVDRGGEFVAKIVLDRSDRKWSAGKTVLKKGDPRVGDDVSNHVFVAGPVACTIPTISLDVVTAASDGSWVALNSKTLAPGPQQFYTVTRAGRFVALIRVDRVNGAQVDARVWQNLSVGRILPGDRAVYVADPMRYLSALPVEVRMDLSSRTSQVSIRAKMGLKE